MSTMECPVCSDSVRIALPNDASVEAITNESGNDANAGGGTKTRQVTCTAGHEVHVTFRVRTPMRSTL